jgi:hypothetical protein
VKLANHHRHLFPDFACRSCSEPSKSGSRVRGALLISGDPSSAMASAFLLSARRVVPLKALISLDFSG